jgi:NAD(P)-dependent dehydrogenase (short-subunit alcohol dehydrogenase family)
MVTFRSAYNAAKAALNALTANVRMDLRKDFPGIHISLVMPGVVLTDFPKHALGGTPGAWTASGNVKPQSAEEVAGILEELIRNPKPEIYTNPTSRETVQRYYADVASFEQGF